MTSSRPGASTTKAGRPMVTSVSDAGCVAAVQHRHNFEFRIDALIEPYGAAWAGLSIQA